MSKSGTKSRVPVSRRTQLESEIIELDDLAEAAADRGDFRAAAAFKGQWIDCRRELARLAEADEIARASDTLERIRKTRKAALRAGAHTAAKDLIRDEIKELERRKLQERELDPTAGLSEEELAEYLREEFSAMPSLHLVIGVRVYCEREGLDFPRRVLAGGQS